MQFPTITTQGSAPGAVSGSTPRSSAQTGLLVTENGSIRIQKDPLSALALLAGITGILGSTYSAMGGAYALGYGTDGIVIAGLAASFCAMGGFIQYHSS
jgi:hypothetical protein